MALLSVEQYKDRDRIEPDAIERLYRRVDTEVRSALVPFGYYEPKITSSLDALDNNRNWRVHIGIDPGPPVLVDKVNVVIRGPGATDANFTRITQNLAIKPGDRLLHARYEALKSALQRTANTYGYFDARMLPMPDTELLVDTAARRASISIAMETGERYRFGATTIQQNAIREDRLRRFLRYAEGEPYDATKALRTQFALDDSQYFSSVEVTQGDRDQSTHSVPMLIRTEPAHRSYRLGPGYGTDTGARATDELRQSARQLAGPPAQHPAPGLGDPAGRRRAL